MSKSNSSIAIIGKGASIKRSTREHVESFNDVATCNLPPYDDYEHLISDRAEYIFLNCGDPQLYRRKRLDSLGVQKIFNTSLRDIRTPPKELLPTNFQLRNYVPNWGSSTLHHFNQHGFQQGGSTGLQALYWALQEAHDYSAIALLGFDFHTAGLPVYYFPKSRVRSSIVRSLYESHFSPEGVIKKPCGHGSAVSARYIIHVAETHPQKSFTLLSDFSFGDDYTIPPNLQIL